MSNAIGTFFVIFLAAFVALAQQGWGGSADIQLNDGRTSWCPDGLVTTPVVVACFTKTNGGKNIFTIPKSEIREIIISLDIKR